MDTTTIVLLIFLGFLALVLLVAMNNNTPYITEDRKFVIADYIKKKPLTIDNECTSNQECFGMNDAITSNNISEDNASCFRGRCYEKDSLVKSLRRYHKDPITGEAVPDSDIVNVLNDR